MTLKQIFLTAYQKELDAFLEEYKKSENPVSPSVLRWRYSEGLETLLATKMEESLGRDEYRTCENEYYREMSTMRDKAFKEIEAHFTSLVESCELRGYQGEIDVVRGETHTRKYVCEETLSAIRVGQLLILFDSRATGIKKYEVIEKYQRRLLHKTYFPGRSKKAREEAEEKLIAFCKELHALCDFEAFDTLPVYYIEKIRTTFTQMKEEFEKETVAA